MSSLSTILQQLSAEAIGKAVDLPHEMARERYQLQSPIVEGFDHFKEVVTEYYRYHDACVRQRNPMGPERAWVEAQQLLQSAFGDLREAVAMASRGMKGGMYVIITAIKEKLKRQDQEVYIQAVFARHINPLDFQQKKALMAEYLGQYARYMSPGAALLTAEELAGNCEAVLKQHADVIDQIRAKLLTL